MQDSPALALIKDIRRIAVLMTGRRDTADGIMAHALNGWFAPDRPLPDLESALAEVFRCMPKGAPKGVADAPALEALRALPFFNRAVHVLVDVRGLPADVAARVLRLPESAVAGLRDWSGAALSDPGSPMALAATA